mgnify:CR=1 FL=1
MEEQRRFKRLPVHLELEVSTLFKQNNAVVTDIHAPIEVFDVSKGGLGFRSKSVLPVGYYFNARLELDQKQAALNCVVRIIRSQDNGISGYIYGCEIVGAASIMDYVFEEYENTIR